MAPLMTRDAMLARLGAIRPWDFVVVGGGATGVGIAVDAASRGYAVAAARAERLRQGHVEPQHEAGARRRALPRAGQHLARHGGAARTRGCCAPTLRTWSHALPFVVPGYDWWEAPVLRDRAEDCTACSPGAQGSAALADPLARMRRSQRFRRCDRRACAAASLYYDGQFDDARLLINLVQTAAEQGAVLLNYARVTGCHHDHRTAGSTAWSRSDVETGRELRVPRAVVINATGPFCRRRAAAWPSPARRADRAEPGHPPRVRPLVPARRLGHHGAARHRTAG